MCGIAGIIHFNSKQPIDQNQLAQMSDAIEHRGPDGSGVYVDDGIGLAHRRLSIIDLTEAANQPFVSENSLFTIVFNGEIFNYIELREDLIARGYTFRTQSDTEVLLSLYQEYGEKMLPMLNGMFAFVIYDKTNQEIFIARDRIGIKPFYYYQTNDSLFFASEPKSIFAGGCPKEFNKEIRDELLLFRYISGENTIFKGVKRLLPGRSALIKNGRMTIKRWWDLPSIIENNRENLPSNPYNWFEETLVSSVKYRTISDVPVGLMLSGGLDSGSLAVALNELGQNSLSSFNVGFNDVLYDESHLAREVSEAFGLDFNTMKIDGKDLFDNLVKATVFYDEPLVHQNDPQMLALSTFAKSKVTVLLSGEGGDELMGGYVRYKPLNYYTLLKAAGVMGSVLKNFGKKGIVNRLDKLSRYTKNNSLQQMTIMNSLNVFPSDLQKLGFNIDGNFCSYRIEIQKEAERLYPKEPARQAMYSDMFIHMSSVLDRNDRMTMGAGIECRVPFLDYRLMEMIPALPSKHLLKGKKGKFLLANSIAKKLPERVLNFKKLGFSVPWDEYFKKNPAFQEMFDNIMNGSLTEFIGEYDFSNNFNINGDFEKLFMRQLLMLEFWRKYYFEDAETSSKTTTA